MLREQLNILKDAVDDFFDGTYDSFDSLNMNEHLNETLCFVGVSEYKLGRALPNAVSTGVSPLYATFTVTALGKRNMSASELVSYIDSSVIPAVRLSILDVRAINRKPCIYSKEQGRYSVSFEVETYCEQSSAYTASLNVFLNGTYYGFFSDWSVSQGYKTYKLGTIYAGSVSGISRKEPSELSVSGELIASQGKEAYSSVAQYLGTVVTVSVDGILFPNLLLKEVKYEKNGESAKLTARLCEVGG